jgi:hypothetical protein
MMRRLAAVPAAVLFLMPLAIAPVGGVAGIALAGLAVAAAAVIAHRWWLAAAAACAFSTAYALALGASAGPVNVPVAVGFGLGLVILLQSVELARRGQRAAVDPAVIRSQIGRWLGLGGVGLAAAVLALELAGRLATGMPLAATPFLAAAGAVGVVLLLAAVMMRMARRQPDLGAAGRR